MEPTGDKPHLIDTTKPNMARVYNWWLGGKDNFEADRELGEKMLDPEKGYPGLRSLATDNRRFVTKAVGRLAGLNYTAQFVDLGCGMPVRPAVHEVARTAEPDARVAYVDNDPVVMSHVRALEATEEGLAAVEADLADPAAVLADPALREVIDLEERTCVILAAVLHYFPAEQAREITAAYAARLAPGSSLVVSTARFEDEVLAARLTDLYTDAGEWHNHSPEDVAGWLEGAGLRLSRGRVADLRCWPLLPPEDATRAACMIGAIGMKSQI